LLQPPQRNKLVGNDIVLHSIAAVYKGTVFNYSQTHASGFEFDCILHFPSRYWDIGYFVLSFERMNESFNNNFGFY